MRRAVRVCGVVVLVMVPMAAAYPQFHATRDFDPLVEVLSGSSAPQRVISISDPPPEYRALYRQSTTRGLATRELKVFDAYGRSPRATGTGKNSRRD